MKEDLTTFLITGLCQVKAACYSTSSSKAKAAKSTGANNESGEPSGWDTVATGPQT